MSDNEDGFDADDLAEYFGDQEGTPEDIFSLVTAIPKRKIKVKAHLQDADGDKIETAKIATELVDFVNREMSKPENNNINTQVFPLITQLMVSYIPRVVGLDYAKVVFAAPALRNTFIHMGMASFLMLQYIKQNNLKIVTIEEEITEQELERMHAHEEEVQSALDRAIKDILNKNGRGPGDEN